MMVPMPKSAAFIAALLVSGVIGAVATSRSVHAQSGCQRVHGRVQSTFTTTNCTSPIGLCTAGKITRGGILDSATTFLALDVAPAAGMPANEPAANLAYSGQLTIETKGGTLQVRDLGVIDGVHNNFTELERPVSGTGRFANASNVFFISGALVNNGTGFDGEIYGELCNVGDGDGDGDHDHWW
jgi:hypothetical protein